MRNFFRFLITLMFVSFFALGQDSNELNPAKSSIPEIKFTELGINLYGKFRFESEGELFEISDNNSKILIPAGAVLTCIRQSYTIGYFAGGANISEGAQSHAIPKLFFILKPSGVVSYHAPTLDGNFPGQILSEPIDFETLHNSRENQTDKADTPNLLLPPSQKPTTPVRGVGE